MKTKVIICATLLLALGSLIFAEHKSHTDGELKFLESIRSYGEKTIFEQNDEELISLGNFTCLLLDEKTTPSKTVEFVVTAGQLQEYPVATGHIITEAVLNICPKHKKLLEVG